MKNFPFTRKLVLLLILVSVGCMVHLFYLHCIDVSALALGAVSGFALLAANIWDIRCVNKQ
ncbi:hypothetical protein IJT17_01850, partial [bacterium]|nr:hypothetical protein [bacterium]